MLKPTLGRIDPSRASSCNLGTIGVDALALAEVIVVDDDDDPATSDFGNAGGGLFATSCVDIPLIFENSPSPNSFC